MVSVAGLAVLGMTRRSVFANHSVSMTSLYREQARIQEGRSAIQKLLN